MFHECAFFIFKQHALGHCWCKEHLFLANSSKSIIFRKRVVFLEDSFWHVFKVTLTLMSVLVGRTGHNSESQTV